jgi:hypothetical protein
MNRNHLFGVFLVSCLVMAGPAFAAPTPTPKASTPNVTAPAAKPASSAPKPATAPTENPALSEVEEVFVEPPERLPENFQPEVDLKRVSIGNQAGLLKIFHRETGKEAYFRTLDDCNTAWFTPEQRQAIFAELGLAADELELAARQVMVDYPKLPKRAVLAFLGAIGSEPTLNPELQALLQRYLAARFAIEKDNILRRQALLSLALMHQVDAQTIEMVTRVFETESNLWLTFPVQMFFQHHACTIRKLALLNVIRERARLVASLYTENVLKSLDEASEPQEPSEGPAPPDSTGAPAEATPPPTEGGPASEPTQPPAAGKSTPPESAPPDSTGAPAEATPPPTEGGPASEPTQPPAAGKSTPPESAPPDSTGAPAEATPPPTEGGPASEPAQPPAAGKSTPPESTPPAPRVEFSPETEKPQTDKTTPPSSGGSP